MALIKCVECGNDISDKATSCPKCGAPVKIQFDAFENINTNNEDNQKDSIENVGNEVNSENEQNELGFNQETKNKKKKWWIIPIIAVGLIGIISVLVFNIIKPYLLKEITITPKSINLGIDERKELKYEIIPAFLSNQKIEWTSSDSEVVSVEKGILRGKGEGKATVTAKSKNGKEAKCTVLCSNILDDWEWDCIYYLERKADDSSLACSFSVDGENCTFVDWQGDTYKGKWKYEETRSGIDVYSFDADGYLDFLITINQDSLSVSPDYTSDLVVFFKRK